MNGTAGVPKVTEVYFERVFNLGNYETFRLGLKATVASGQSAEEVAKDLDAMTVKIRNERNEKRGQ